MLQRNLFLLLNCSKHVSVFLALGVFWCAHKLHRHGLGLRSVGERYGRVTAGHLWGGGGAGEGRGRQPEPTPRDAQATRGKEGRKHTAALTCCRRRSMGTWSGSGGLQRHVRSTSLYKRASQGEPAFPRPSLPAPGGLRAGRGSRALCAFLGSFEASRATGPPGPAPGRAGQSQRAWPRGPRGEGGCCARGRRAAAGENLPPLPSRPPPPPPAPRPGRRSGRAREGEAAPRPGRQQVGGSAAGLLRLPDGSLALGQSLRPLRQPYTCPLLSSVAAGRAVRPQRLARGRGPGEAVAAGEAGVSAFQPGRVLLSLHPPPTP